MVLLNNNFIRNNVQTFDVYLLQRNGSFTFDLDLSRVALVQ